MLFSSSVTLRMVIACVALPQLSANPIEVTNTDTDAELFLQRRLHRSAGHLWIGVAKSLQPLENGFL
jgi:hypothetical protein